MHLPLTIKHLSHVNAKACTVPRRRGSWCRVSVTRRWQLVSRRRLLQITCEPGAFKGSKGVGIFGPHIARRTWWLLTALWLGGWPPSVPFQSHAARFTSRKWRCT